MYTRTYHSLFFPAAGSPSPETSPAIHPEHPVQPPAQPETPQPPQPVHLPLPVRRLQIFFIRIAAVVPTTNITIITSAIPIHHPLSAIIAKANRNVNYFENGFHLHLYTLSYRNMGPSLTGRPPWKTPNHTDPANNMRFLYWASES